MNNGRNTYERRRCRRASTSRTFNVQLRQAERRGGPPHPPAERDPRRAAHHRGSLLPDQEQDLFLAGQQQRSLWDRTGAARRVDVRHRPRAGSRRPHVRDGRLPQSTLQRFRDDVERAWAVGLSRGLGGDRRLMAPATLAAHAAPFRRFANDRAAGDRRTICIISQEYPPDRTGGIGRYVHHMARGIAARGHHVHVLTAAAAQDSIAFEDGVLGAPPGGAPDRRARGDRRGGTRAHLAPVGDGRRRDCQDRGKASRHLRLRATLGLRGRGAPRRWRLAVGRRPADAAAQLARQPAGQGRRRAVHGDVRRPDARPRGLGARTMRRHPCHQPGDRAGDREPLSHRVERRAAVGDFARSRRLAPAALACTGRWRCRRASHSLRRPARAAQGHRPPPGRGQPSSRAPPDAANRCRRERRARRARRRHLSPALRGRASPAVRRPPHRLPWRGRRGEVARLLPRLRHRRGAVALRVSSGWWRSRR